MPFSDVDRIDWLETKATGYDVWQGYDGYSDIYHIMYDAVGESGSGFRGNYDNLMSDDKWDVSGEDDTSDTKRMNWMEDYLVTISGAGMKAEYNYSYYWFYVNGIGVIGSGANMRAALDSANANT